MFNDDEGIGAFVYMKDENEPIILANTELPAVPRMKIGTFKLSERIKNQRLGEGALGLTLWQWRRKQAEEVYVTVFEKHESLISLLKWFGFNLVGYNKDGECVYLKSRLSSDYTDPYKSFPFIDPCFRKAGYILVNDYYHDTISKRY